MLLLEILTVFVGKIGGREEKNKYGGVICICTVGW